MHEQFYNLPWATLIHPKSIVSKSAKINEGSVVLAAAVIQPPGLRTVSQNSLKSYNL